MTNSPSSSPDGSAAPSAILAADKAALMAPSKASQHISIRGRKASTSPPIQQSSGNMEREYEFFVTTDEPHQPDGPERGRIRRLVMRNFFESKWSDPTNNSSENSSASTVQAKKNLKSRFRLPKPGQDVEPKKSKAKTTSARRNSREEAEKREKRPKISRTQSGTSDPYDASSKSRTSSGRGSPINIAEGGVTDAGTSHQKPRLLLKINPNAHRFDPFDVLPVQGSPQLDMLFKLYKSGSRVNSIAINAGNTWWTFVSNDAGLLHATLATWALYGMLVRGLSDLRVEKLRHKNEAIKEINTKIGIPGSSISDELVGTVLTLASFENLLGAYDAAQLHIAALKRMVNARGGLFAFAHNDGLVRGIIWVDFHTAAAFHTTPIFPQIHLDPDTPPLPDPLLEEAAFTSPTSLLQLPLAAIDAFNIFYRLHRLALAISSPWIKKVSRLTLSNLLYECEYTILSVPDYTRSYLDFDRGSRGADEDEETFEERRTQANAASIIEAILAAAQIFLFAGLRDIPLKAKIFSILLERLRGALDRPSTSPSCKFPIWEIFHGIRNEKVLLWTLVVGASVSTSWGGREWWIERLEFVLRQLGINSKKVLEVELRRVAWTDEFFGNEVLGGLWRDLGIGTGNAVCLAQTEIFIEKAREGESGKEENTIDPRLLDTEVVGEGLGELSGSVGTAGTGVLYDEDTGRWMVRGWYI